MCNHLPVKCVINSQPFLSFRVLFIDYGNLLKSSQSNMHTHVLNRQYKWRHTVRWLSWWGNPFIVAFLGNNVQCLQTVKLQWIKNAYRRDALKTDTVNFMSFLLKLNLIRRVHIQKSFYNNYCLVFHWKHNLNSTRANNHSLMFNVNLYKQNLFKYWQYFIYHLKNEKFAIEIVYKKLWLFQALIKKQFWGIFPPNCHVVF